MVAPASGAPVLQCVPYARIVSGVDIRGDALSWWDQAESRYTRGSKPKKGAVLAFRPNGPMALGHVAVVSKVLDDRRVLIRHANWSVPGSIEEDVLTVDVSDAGDWSQVRVWFSPYGQMGARTNPTYGFIYPAKGRLRDFTPDPSLGESTRLASLGPRDWDDVDLAMKKAVPATASAPRFAAPPTPVYPRGPALAQAADRRKADRAPKLAADPFIVEYADSSASAPRSLGDIIADVKRDARLN